MLIINIIGPSGSGKTSVVERLGYQQGGSVTTRKPRGDDDKGYLFVSKDEFITMLDAGRFIEYVNNYGDYYGMPVPDETKDVLTLIVEPCGAMQISKWAIDNGHHYANIYIDIPASIAYERMAKRGDSEESIAKRIAKDTYFYRLGPMIADHIADGTLSVEESVAQIQDMINEEISFYNYFKKTNEPIS